MSIEQNKTPKIKSKILSNAYKNLFEEHKDDRPDDYYADSPTYCHGVRRAALSALEPLIKDSGGLRKFYEDYKEAGDRIYIGDDSSKVWGRHEERSDFYKRHESSIMEFYEKICEELGLAVFINNDNLSADESNDWNTVGRKLLSSNNLLGVATIISCQQSSGVTSIGDLKWSISGDFIRKSVEQFYVSVESELEKENEKSDGKSIV